jgi:hypothetical protein
VVALQGAIVARTREAVLLVDSRNVDGRVADAMVLVLKLVGGEVGAVGSCSTVAVVVVEEAVHCSRVCLCGLCLDLKVWAVVEGGCRRYLVVDTGGIAGRNFEVGGEETTGRR